MNRKIKIIFSVISLIIILSALAVPAFAANESKEASETVSAEAAEQAEEQNDSSVTKSKAFAAAVLVALASSAGAIGMSIAVKSASNGISRQPEASGDIRTNTMLGLVFIETAIIYALIVAILIIFVL